LDTSQFQSNQVFLNVYDMGESGSTFRNINRVATANHNLLLGGVFHASVEIYGKEYCYESSDSEHAGVSSLPPRSHTQHSYRTTVPLGRTELSEEEVQALLRRLSAEWSGSEYDPIHHNGLNFCNTLCQELGLGRIPGWVDRVSRTCSLIDSTSRTAAEQVEQTVRSVLSEAQPNRLSEVAQAQAQEFQAQAQEIAEAAQAAQAQAAQVAQQHAQALGEAAQAAQAQVQEQVQVLGEAVQAQAQVFGEKAQELSQELLGENLVEKAQELTERTQQHARSLWQRAQAAALKLREDALTTTTTTSPQRGGEEVRNDSSAPFLLAGTTATGLWDTTLGGLFGNAGAAEAAAEQPEEMKCPAGHQMQPWIAKAGTCDGCARKVQNGEQVMDCRQCDWYLCDECSNGLKGPATLKVSTPKVSTPTRGSTIATAASPPKVPSAATVVSCGPPVVVDLAVGDDELSKDDAAEAEEEQE
jgi:hypothetical protein